MSGSGGDGGGGIFEQLFRMPITVFNSSLGILNQTMRGASGAAGSSGSRDTGNTWSSNRGSTSSDGRIEVRGEAETRGRRGRESGEAGVSMRFKDDSGRERGTRDSGREGDYERDRERNRGTRARDYERDRERGRDRDKDGERVRRLDDRGARRDCDRDLGGDRLKLVRYKILFVKRDYEVAFQEREELVADDMSDTDFTAWKVAEFIQRLGEEEIPKQWRERNYPRQVAPGEGATINELREADKKYLRVYWEVLARYDREEFHHDERQVEVLGEIREAIHDLNRKP